MIDLQKFTCLPLKTVAVADKLFPDVLVMTPHRGQVIVPLKKEHYPFLFGSVTQRELHLDEVLRPLSELESESYGYLMKEWLKTQEP